MQCRSVYNLDCCCNSWASSLVYTVWVCTVWLPAGFSCWVHQRNCSVLKKQQLQAATETTPTGHQQRKRQIKNKCTTTTTTAALHTTSLQLVDNWKLWIKVLIIQDLPSHQKELKDLFSYYGPYWFHFFHLVAAVAEQHWTH